MTPRTSGHLPLLDAMAAAKEVRGAQSEVPWTGLWMPENSHAAPFWVGIVFGIKVVEYVKTRGEVALYFVVTLGYVGTLVLWLSLQGKT